MGYSESAYKNLIFAVLDYFHFAWQSLGIFRALCEAQVLRLDCHSFYNFYKIAKMLRHTANKYLANTEINFMKLNQIIFTLDRFVLSKYCGLSGMSKNMQIKTIGTVMNTCGLVSYCRYEPHTNPHSTPR